MGVITNRDVTDSRRSHWAEYRGRALGRVSWCTGVTRTGREQPRSSGKICGTDMADKAPLPTDPRRHS